jgi:hypothetical protein
LDLATEAQQDRYLAGVAKGAILTAAMNEPGSALPERPATTLTDGRLNGTKIAVPYAGQATWMLVTTDSGVVVVSPDHEGVRVSKTPSSAGGDEFAVEFRDVAVEPDAVLAGAGVNRFNQLALAAIGAWRQFDNNDSKVFGNADWRAVYGASWFAQKTQAEAEKLSEMGDAARAGERKAYEKLYMRNPLAGAVLVALAGDVAAQPSVAAVIRHYDYNRISMSEFFFAECAFYAMPPAI